MGYQICVYAMCKNEEPFVDRWIHSMKEADMIVVMDTGSTDNTAALLRSRGAVVYTARIDPWRWDAARERSLSYVPDDVDICVATDLDDVWTPGWRTLLEKAWQPGTTRARHLYNYSISPDGRPLKQNPYHSRIHARYGYQWTRANHEYLQYIGNSKETSAESSPHILTSPEKIVDVEGLTLNHYPDLTKSRTFNLALTKLALQEDPNDIDMLYCLGMDYFHHKLFVECKEAFLRFLAHPTADEQTLVSQRSQAMALIAQCLELQGDLEEAYQWFFKAASEDSKHPDALTELAMAAYRRMDWPTVLSSVSKALNITDISGGWGGGVSCSHIPYHMASMASCALGLLPQALDYAKQASALSPDDSQLQQNVQNIESLLL